MSLYFMDETHEWVNIGHAVSDATISALEGEFDRILFDSWSWYAPQTTSMEFKVEYLNHDLIELMLGQPIHPRKCKGLTGKAYRQACRAHRRRLKAFRRGEEDWRGVA